jgi:hypothetical protein
MGIFTFKRELTFQAEPPHAAGAYAQGVISQQAAAGVVCIEVETSMGPLKLRTSQTRAVASLAPHFKLASSETSFRAAGRRFA